MYVRGYSRQGSVGAGCSLTVSSPALSNDVGKIVVATSALARRTLSQLDARASSPAETPASDADTDSEDGSSDTVVVSSETMLHEESATGQQAPTEERDSSADWQVSRSTVKLRDQLVADLHRLETDLGHLTSEEVKDVLRNLSANLQRLVLGKDVQDGRLWLNARESIYGDGNDVVVHSAVADASLGLLNGIEDLKHITRTSPTSRS